MFGHDKNVFFLQSWFLLVVSVLAFLSGGASAVGISVATVRAIMYEGQTLFAHCQLPANITYYSITNECPFDPTRIYVSQYVSCVICQDYLTNFVITNIEVV